MRVRVRNRSEFQDEITDIYMSHTRRSFYTGATGFTGFTGETGYTGQTGFTGNTGFTGTSRKLLQ